MRNILGKIVIVLAFILASIPLALLVKGIVQLVRPAEEMVVASNISPQPTLPYEVSYCSDKVKDVEFVPEHITIQNADIDLQVVSVPLENGTWKVNTGVANFAEGTSTVNLKSGNVGIFAHDRKNGFAGIKTLVEGSSIEVYGGGYMATYRVEKSAIANPSDVDVFYPSEVPNLTLVTCNGTFSEKRYIIQATLVSVKEKC
jgi:LPXTG-site transpeptidase (sortase) family protein